MNKTQTQKEKNTQSKQKNHKTWGDEIGKTHQLYSNPSTKHRGITPMERGQFTLNLLKMYTNKNKVDICRLTETNTNWSEVPYKQQLQQHTRTWWECAQWTMACN